MKTSEKSHVLEASGLKRSSTTYMDDSVSADRRGFLKAGCGAVGGILVAGAPSIISGQTITNAIKIGLVGCGGRGTGAASQALLADANAELVAVADVDRAQIQKSLASLRSIGKIASRVKTDAHQFVGLDSYQKLIASDVDLVLLATPPGFRPLHLSACIDNNKHVFCEKPVATDAHGVRSVLQTAERAKSKNLSLVGGLGGRYSAITQQMFQAISEGAIGRITTYNATYYGNTVKPMLPANARSRDMSDTEWQIRNWYNFVWLSGDGIVEQAIHSVDRIAWAMHDAPPLYCLGTGGRSVPSLGGNIYDHFSISYSYPEGVQAFLNFRQIDGCEDEVSDYIIGTQGTCTLGRGPYPIFQGTKQWALTHERDAAIDFLTQNSGTLGQRLGSKLSVDAYQAEQNALLASIRDRKPLNDGKRMATSTLLAIMGRMAAYTGQKVGWEQALNLDDRLTPEKLDWNAQLAVAPRAQPGRTRLA